MPRVALRLGVFLGVLLGSTVENDRTFAAPSAAPQSLASLRIASVQTPMLWNGSHRGEITVTIDSDFQRIGGSSLLLSVSPLDAAHSAKPLWTSRIEFHATRGQTTLRARCAQPLPFGPYAVSAVVGNQNARAFFVVSPRATPSRDLTLLLPDARRETVEPIAGFGLHLAAPPLDDSLDGRVRRDERSARFRGNVETVAFEEDAAALSRGREDATRLISSSAVHRSPRDWPQIAPFPLAVDWPSDSAPLAAQTSASASRALQANARYFGHLSPFAVVLPRESSASPRVVAHELAAQTATAWAAGAREVFIPFDTKNEALSALDARRLAAASALERMRGNFGRSLFGSSPLLRGTSFRMRRGHSALLWLERNSNRRARLITKLEARVFDLWGNEIGRENKGVLVVPLGIGPVWVQSVANERTWNRAWQTASLEGTRLLAAQVLPLARETGTQALRIRLQNTGIAPLSGTLSLSPPPGWSLSDDDMSFRLAPGEARVLRFGVAVSQSRADGVYPVTVVASRGASTTATRWTWTQNARVAVAPETATAPSIDGDLADWKEASWMRVAAGENSARVALRWDNTRFYVAAEVREREFAPVAREEFWNGNAIQFAFGLRDDAASRPQNGPFRDTDFGFLLVPWKNADGTFGARILRGWSSTIPFDGFNGVVLDRMRWGGAVPGSEAALRRDGGRGITRYEASFPHAEMATLRPARRASENIAVRFSFLTHSPRQPALSWSRANNVFAWWGNAVSFQNGGAISPAAQVPLFFSAIASAELLPALPPAAPPRPAPQTPREMIPPLLPDTRRAPETRARVSPPPRRSRQPRRRPTTDDQIPLSPPNLEPMQPRTLPPAAPPPGTRIPPAPVTSE
jgi:hypothetical protein